MGSVGGGAVYIPPGGRILRETANIKMNRMPVHQDGIAYENAE
jgi:hypothetical protein